MLKASSLYPAYVQSIYATHFDLQHASYLEQNRIFMEGALGWADFWKQCLERTGDFIVEELIINAEPMQKQWAREHGIRYSSRNWILDILDAQINAFGPDVIFTHDFTYITPDFRLKIRKKYSQVKLMIGYDGITLHDVNRFRGVDLMLTGAENTVQYYQSQGVDALYIFMGFEEDILRRIGPSKKRYPVSFVGGVYLFKGGHYQRLELLKRLHESVDIDLWLSGYSLKQTLKNTLGYFRGGDIKNLAMYLKASFDLALLYRHSRGEVFGLDMYRVLSSSDVTINSHIDFSFSIKKAGNMRLFEATGVGTCLLTDWEENLGDLFVIDKEVVAYRTIDECVEKAKYLMEHPDVRQAIAKAGQKRTLKDYSFKKMTQTLSDYLKLIM